MIENDECLRSVISCSILPSRNVWIRIWRPYRSWLHSRTVSSRSPEAPPHLKHHAVCHTTASMTSRTRDYVPSAAYGRAESTYVGSSSYEVFWHRVPMIVYPNCLLALFCSFYEWLWLGLTLAACCALMVLGVALTECLAFDHRCDTAPDIVRLYTDIKGTF